MLGLTTPSIIGTSPPATDVSKGANELALAVRIS